MKRQITAGLAILAVAAGVGLKLASHRETSAALKAVSLIQRSEHSQPGKTEALAGIRVRISPGNFEEQLAATARQVPQIALEAE